MRANVASLIAERNWLSDELTQLGVEPVPSSTNFVLVKLPSPSVAARVHASCLRQGLVLRSYESNQALRSYLRITARLREHDQRLVNTLEQDF
jgi:histidinol-phosphate/aromatic aminotransferase/cobyric acid decarboxylase-like protein